MQNLGLEILKILRASSDYITAQDLADRLHVSRRTIFNNLEEAREICSLQEAEIFSQKAKGYKLKSSAQLDSYLENQAGFYEQIYKSERKFYIIYLLLVEDESIRIKELEDILYVSRPTVYKMLHETEKWFEKFDIELRIERRGVRILYGERRYREALKCWIAEVIKTIQIKEANHDTSDHLKLRKSAYEFLNDDFQRIRSTIEIICTEFRIHCSMHEMINLAILLEVVIYRNKKGHTVSLSNRLLNLIIDIYTEDEIRKVGDIIQYKLNIDFPKNEIVYLIANCLINGDFEDEAFLNNRIHNLHINTYMYEEISEYIKSHLNLETIYLEELMKDIVFITKRELLFQIKGDNGTSAKYYDEMSKEFSPIIISTVHDIYIIILQYYNIVYHEKMICNLMFCLLNVLIKSMKKLKGALIHNCDSFEMKYIISSLKSIDLVTVEFESDNEEIFEEYCLQHDIDLIFSTLDYTSDKIKVFRISKVLGTHELNQLFGKINILHQRKNLIDLINRLNK